MNMDAIDQAFRFHATSDWLALDGWALRDASLEDVEHYFVYHADEHAAAFLGSPDPDDGLRRAA